MHPVIRLWKSCTEGNTIFQVMDVSTATHGLALALASAIFLIHLQKCLHKMRITIYMMWFSHMLGIHVDANLCHLRFDYLQHIVFIGADRAAAVKASF